MRATVKAALTVEEVHFVNHVLTSLKVSTRESLVRVFEAVLDGINHTISLTGNTLVVSVVGEGEVKARCSDESWKSFVRTLRWETVEASNRNIHIPFAGVTI